MADSYPALMSALAGARQALEVEQGSAYQWQQEQLAAAQTAVQRAERVVAQAQEQVAGAQLLVDRVDSESVLLWRALGARLGPTRARRLGTAPQPAAGDSSGDGAEPGALLRRVRATLDSVPARRVRPLWLSAVLLLFAVAVVAGGAFLLLALYP